ncbi:hypothetical protein AAG906_021536 [Vitis piasezkii]
MVRLLCKCSWVWLLLLVHKHPIHALGGCIERERRGLLEFKAFLMLNNEDPDLLLPSWVDDESSNCCEWERVGCDPITGQVPEYHANDKYWLLNASLFLPFGELRNLIYQQIHLMDALNLKVCFEKLSSLKTLEVLNISSNEFDNNIIGSLKAITSLKILVMWKIGLYGSFPIRELASLIDLEILDLRHNVLEGFRSSTQGYESLSTLGKLETLNLGYNSFNQTIIQQLSTLTSLKNLILDNNINFEGSFPAQELSALKNLVTLDLSWDKLNTLKIEGGKGLVKLNKLEHLDLSSNNLTDTHILELLATLPALKSLSLADNYMEQPLSDQDLEAFSNLEILNLRLNCLTGSVPSSIRALSSLKVLSLSNNRLNSSLSIQGLCELKKLEELDLSLNSFEGILPPCLNNLTSLRLLDLSQNLLTGSISSSLIAGLSSLVYIDLSHNHFEGSFSFSSFANHSKLEVVEFTNDNKNLRLKLNIQQVPMFQLKVLIISNCNLNKLTGGIPKFLQYQYSLTVVDLSLNNLSGSFPNWLLENNRDLKFLNLRHNSFMGQIHLTCCPNIYLDWMDISDNLFNGQLQENIALMIPQLSHLNLSKNGFEGNILSLVVQMSNLKELDVSGNDFSGEVPKQFVGGCHNLKVLKLSNNGFRGQIFSEYFNLTGLEDSIRCNHQKPFKFAGHPYNYMSGEMPNWIGNTTLRTLAMGNNSFKVKPTVLEHLHLQGNRFTGAIPEDFLNSLSLLTLDIRDNSLNGSIPKSIVALSNLRILLLGGNHLSGLIPNHLCQLTKISLMDLSNNSFLGQSLGVWGISIWETTTSDNVFAPSSQYFYINGDIYDEQDEVEFVTKYRSGSYKGDILNFMSGLDLSCNNLTDEIPRELGNLSSLHALNLSHNELQGIIPKGFSNLSQIESLDLSYNRLTVFTVVHNNFSGRVPDLKQQFGIFDETSYDGYPFLCGPLLKKKCSINPELPYSPVALSDMKEVKWYDIDRVVFSASFGAAYITILLAFATALYVNPHWRWRWFNFIEDCIYLCYYFPFDAFNKILAYLHK